MDIDKTIRRHGLVSDQVDAGELAVILAECEKALAVPGAVVEFGCYRGTTSLYLRRLLDYHNDDRAFHVYDSFVGLPEKTAPDQSPAGTQFVAGELSVSKKYFVTEFKKAGLRLPVVHKAWFSDLTDSDIPSPIAFAFLDGDYYESVRDSLRLIEDRLGSDAIIVIDDYSNEALPGAARAADEWVRGRHLTIRVVRSLGIVRL